MGHCFSDSLAMRRNEQWLNTNLSEADIIDGGNFYVMRISVLKAIYLFLNLIPTSSSLKTLFLKNEESNQNEINCWIPKCANSWSSERYQTSKLTKLKDTVV